MLVCMGMEGVGERGIERSGKESSGTKHSLQCVIDDICLVLLRQRVCGIIETRFFALFGLASEVQRPGVWHLRGVCAVPIRPQTRALLLSMHFEPWLCLGASQKGQIYTIFILHSDIALAPQPSQSTAPVPALHFAILLRLVTRAMGMKDTKSS